VVAVGGWLSVVGGCWWLLVVVGSDVWCCVKERHLYVDVSRCAQDSICARFPHGRFPDLDRAIHDTIRGHNQLVAWEDAYENEGVSRISIDFLRWQYANIAERMMLVRAKTNTDD
jgi:hypothetical protein